VYLTSSQKMPRGFPRGEPGRDTSIYSHAWGQRPWRPVLVRKSSAGSDPPHASASIFPTPLDNGLPLHWDFHGARGLCQKRPMPRTARSTTKTPVKSHDRAKGQTLVSISLAKELLEQIDQCAEADSRNRSNWIVQRDIPRVNYPQARRVATGSAWRVGCCRRGRHRSTMCAGKYGAPFSAVDTFHRSSYAPSGFKRIVGPAQIATQCVAFFGGKCLETIIS
jgi:hypothetical protein